MKFPRKDIIIFPPYEGEVKRDCNIPKKNYLIIPGSLFEYLNPLELKAYEEMSKKKFLRFENKDKFILHFIYNKEKKEIKKLLKSLTEPFAVLILKEVSKSDIRIFKKHSMIDPNCRIYTEVDWEIPGVTVFDGLLEHFIVMTKRDLVPIEK